MENEIITEEKIKELREHLNEFLPTLTIVNGYINSISNLRLGVIDKKIDLTKSVITICVPAIIGALALNSLPINRTLFITCLSLISIFMFSFWNKLLEKREELSNNSLGNYAVNGETIAAILKLYTSLFETLKSSIEAEASGKKS